MIINYKNSQLRQNFFCFAFMLFLSSCSYLSHKHAIENWHKLRATGDVAFYKHDYAAAQKSYQEALNIAQVMLDQPVRKAVVLEDLSKVYLATNNRQETENIFNQALELANKRTQAPAKQLEKIEESLGPCLNNIGQILVNAKKYEEATIAFRQARAMFLDLYKRTSPLKANFIVGSYLAWSIDGLGTSYKELGQLNEARKAYFSVLDYNIVNGLSLDIRKKLTHDFFQIPDTSYEARYKFSRILGCPMPELSQH